MNLIEEQEEIIRLCRRCGDITPHILLLREADDELTLEWMECNVCKSVLLVATKKYHGNVDLSRKQHKGG